MKICKDCIHCVEEKNCNALQTHVVTGEALKKNPVHRCIVMRDLKGYCGIEGKLFTHKVVEQFNQQLDQFEEPAKIYVSGADLVKEMKEKGFLNSDGSRNNEAIASAQINHFPEEVGPASPGFSEEELQAAESDLRDDYDRENQEDSKVKLKINVPKVLESINKEGPAPKVGSLQDIIDNQEPEPLCSKCTDKPVVFVSTQCCEDCHVPAKRKKKGGKK